MNIFNNFVFLSLLFGISFGFYNSTDYIKTQFKYEDLMNIPM